MNSAVYLIGGASDIIYSDEEFDETKFNKTLGPLLLKGGLTLGDQWQKLVDIISQNMTATNVTELDDQSLAELQGVWYYRLQMSATLNTYIVSWFCELNPRAALDLTFLI
jgi:hypothetical protein